MNPRLKRHLLTVTIMLTLLILLTWLLVHLAGRHQDEPFQYIAF